MERMRGMEPSFINEMLGERRGRRNFFGNLELKGHPPITIQIDDYRFKGEFVEVIESWTLRVLSYPRERVGRLVTDRRNLDGHEGTFNEGSNARPSK